MSLMEIRRMDQDRVKSVLDALFASTGDGPKLLNALREDLRREYKALNLKDVLEQAQASAIERAQDIDPTQAAVRILAASEGAADKPKPGRLYDPRCFPEGRRTDGWFACHAFRIARVHDEVRKVQKAWVDSGSALPEIIRKAWGGKPIPADRNKIDEALQLAFNGVTGQAGTYDCGCEFEGLFVTALSRKAIDVHRRERSKKAEGVDIDVLAATVHSFEDEQPVPGLTPKAQSFEVLQKVPRLTPKEWLVLIGEEGIELTPELFLSTARAELQREKIKNPSPDMVERKARLLRELLDRRTRKDAPDNLAEMVVARLHHRDFLRALPPGDPARPVFEEVGEGIGALIAAQRAMKRGERVAGAGEAGGVGPVGRLATIQKKLWGQLDGQSEDGPVQSAAINLKWFSWLLTSAARLAACLRYAERLNDPTVREMVDTLTREDCLRNIPQEKKERLRQFADAADKVVPGSADAGWAALILRSGLRLGAGMLNRPQVKPVGDALPDTDWEWWVSRVTKTGMAQADGRVHRLAESAGLGASSQKTT
jgi:hypothetical protein